MTAFGRAAIVASVGRFVVEIQSVNRKFLEIQTNLPKELSCFDPDVRKWISASIFRGQVIVKVFVHFENVAPLTVTPNLPLINQLLAAWYRVGEELGAKPNKDQLFSLIANEEEIFRYDIDLENEKLYREPLREAIALALEKFSEMREREGKALKEDISGRLRDLTQWIDLIEFKAPDASNRYRQRLIEKLNEVLPGCVENEDKILREVVLFAEKIDIAEEITRFRSHLMQFHELLDSESQNIGKTLDFLIQELNREINTIGSKSSEITITQKVVAVKSELERIREQIQNIE